MTVERSSLGVKKVIVGIRLDDHAKELLDWALVKVADSGDSVVAIHVCRNSVADSVSKEKIMLDGYLEDYEGLCSEKQVALSVSVLKGNSIRKMLVREAKNHSASAVILGIAKHGSLRRWTSIAKYCAKRLPQTTEVMAIKNGKIVLSRCLKTKSEGHCSDPKPSFYLNGNFTPKNNHSEFGESESEMSRFSFDGNSSNIMIEDVHVLIPNVQRQQKRGSLSSISLPAEDFTKQRPGWPLLQTASSLTQEALEARKLPLVKWVMTLPHRSLPDIAETNPNAACKTELHKDLETVLSKNSAGCKVFSYDVLKISTSEFSSGNLIGKGGCNFVYKGILPEGKPVAVKISESSSKEAWKNFILEVDIMTTLKHNKIAPLIGICVKDNDLISVYDFMSKGSLEENLHGTCKEKTLLSWEARFKIAVEIAEALNYVHNECPRPVIHRDVKSSNILLTDELEPLLCDFGLAIWAPTKASFVMDTNVVGTFGYLAPEYFMYGKVSDKIDVYAFGVILLELLSGKKPIGLETDKGQESLVMWAKPKLENRDFKSILDPNLDGNIDEAQMQRMAQAAAFCLAQSSRLRPKMSQILTVLKGEKNYEDEENEDDDYYNDDEVYPDSSAESHLGLALFDVNFDSSNSFSSIDQNSLLSVEAYLQKRWSRISSID
ncbi:Protein kinase protein with adenine nucleotide alpha hydrolases-like domain [Striga hermonthica]|uniref:Protein kinase protein with adenine nucleotide alpha hydrolases-like domain n=1 Tax=Striga hermonthica TaxID=68872 RepID=A0A9N7R2F4_STRHE|nr:Protein kinase protein with adenine nucleotide alpha hydrolases-like domain [Striga hermonthica]